MKILLFPKNEDEWKKWKNEKRSDWKVKGNSEIEFKLEFKSIKSVNEPELIVKEVNVKVINIGCEALLNGNQNVRKKVLRKILNKIESEEPDFSALHLGSARELPNIKKITKNNNLIKKYNNFKTKIKSYTTGGDLEGFIRELLNNPRKKLNSICNEAIDKDLEEYLKNKWTKEWKNKRGKLPGGIKIYDCQDNIQTDNDVNKPIYIKAECEHNDDEIIFYTDFNGLEQVEELRRRKIRNPIVLITFFDQGLPSGIAPGVYIWNPDKGEPPQDLEPISELTLEDYVKTLESIVARVDEILHGLTPGTSEEKRRKILEKLEREIGKLPNELKEMLIKGNTPSVIDSIKAQIKKIAEEKEKQKQKEQDYKISFENIQWKILLLEDDDKHYEIIKNKFNDLNLDVENNLIRVKNYKDGMKELKKDTKNEITVIISDYRLRYGFDNWQHKQGYDFIEDVATKTDHICALFALTGLEKTNIIKLRNELKVNINHYTKDRIFSNYSDFLDFADTVLKKGNEEHEAIINVIPNDEVKKYYRNFRLSGNYEQKLKIIFQEAKNLYVEAKNNEKNVGKKLENWTPGKNFNFESFMKMRLLVLALYYDELNDIKEIADKLGIAEKSINNKLFIRKTDLKLLPEEKKWLKENIWNKNVEKYINNLKEYIKIVLDIIPDVEGENLDEVIDKIKQNNQSGQYNEYLKSVFELIEMNGDDDIKNLLLIDEVKKEFEKIKRSLGI